MQPFNDAIDEVVELCLRILSQPRNDVAFAELCRLLRPEGPRSWQSTFDPEIAALLKASPVWAAAVAGLTKAQVSDRSAIVKSLANILLDIRRGLYFGAIEHSRSRSAP